MRRTHLQLQKLEPYFLNYLLHLKLDHVVNIGGVDYLWIYEGARADYFAGPSTLTGKAIHLGYDLEDLKMSAGDALSVKLYWQAKKTMNISYKVFVHLIGPDRALVAQHDGVPSDGAIPTDDWFVGEVVVDRHLVEFPDFGAGGYSLVVGMYNPATGERLPVSGSDTVISYLVTNFINRLK